MCTCPVRAVSARQLKKQKHPQFNRAQIGLGKDDGTGLVSGHWSVIASWSDVRGRCSYSDCTRRGPKPRARFLRDAISRPCGDGERGGQKRMSRDIKSVLLCV